MNMNSKLLFTAVAAVSLMATSFGQSQTMVVGKSFKGVPLDLKKFNPQIDVSPKLKHVEKDHEMGFRVPMGIPTNLIPGGVLPDPRITIANSSLFPGITATGWEPPDPDIAVGPNHIVEVVNSTIAIYSKTGNKVFEQTGQSFFAGISPEAFDFDPKVIYDQVAKRFIYVDLGLNDQSSGGTASLLIAVSNTSDPVVGGWKLFKVDVKQTNGSNNYWWDYPGLGYNKDMICLSGNMFAMQGSSGFNGVQLVTFDKATLYGGTATPFKTTESASFTIQLAKTLDSTSTSVYGVETESHNSMRLTAITKVGANFVADQSVVAVPTWADDQGFITGPGGINVRTDGNRQFVAASRGGRVLSSHTVAVSSSDDRPAARWYDFKTNNWPASGTPTLFQSGQLDPPAGHGYSFPAINMDIKGGIGMCFSMVGTSTPGKLMGTGRKPTDPSGSMGSPVLLEGSTAAQYVGSTRWGDYHDVELDPTDSRTFWAVGMGAGNQGRWATYIKSFKISAADADLTQVQASGISTVAGTLVSGNKASLNPIDSNVLSIQSQSVKALGQVAGFNAVYGLPFTGAVDTLRLSINVAGPTGSSALISLLNRNTGAYDQMTTLGLSPTGVSKTLDLSPNQIALYVNSSNQVSMIIRAVNPTRAGTFPAPFLFNTDLAILLTAAVPAP